MEFRLVLDISARNMNFRFIKSTLDNKTDRLHNLYLADQAIDVLYSFYKPVSLTTLIRFINHYSYPQLSYRIYFGTYDYVYYLSYGNNLSTKYQIYLPILRKKFPEIFKT